MFHTRGLTGRLSHRGSHTSTEEKQGFIQPTPLSPWSLSLCLSLYLSLSCIFVPLYRCTSLSHTHTEASVQGQAQLRSSLLFLRARHPRAGCGFLVAPALAPTRLHICEGAQLRTKSTVTAAHPGLHPPFTGVQRHGASDSPPPSPLPLPWRRLPDSRGQVGQIPQATKAAISGRQRPNPLCYPMGQGS